MCCSTLRAQRVSTTRFLGNGDPTLHAHIQPRHAHEDEAKRRGSVELYGDELSLVPFDPERDRPLRWAVYKGLKVRGLCRS